MCALGTLRFTGTPHIVKVYNIFFLKPYIEAKKHSGTEQRVCFLAYRLHILKTGCKSRWMKGQTLKPLNWMEWRLHLRTRKSHPKTESAQVYHRNRKKFLHWAQWKDKVKMKGSTRRLGIKAKTKQVRGGAESSLQWNRWPHLMHSFLLLRTMFWIRNL